MRQNVNYTESSTASFTEMSHKSVRRNDMQSFPKTIEFISAVQSI